MTLRRASWSAASQAVMVMFGAERGELFAGLLGAGCVRSVAADEEDVFEVVCGDEVVGGECAEDAGASGDECGAVWVDGLGDGEDEFAGVFGLAHVPERLRGSAYVPGAYGQRREHALLDQADQLREHLLYPVGRRVHQVERPVPGAGMRGGDRGRLADVGLAHLDEAAAGFEQAQRRVGEVAGEGVEYDVDGGEAVLEFQGAGGGEVVFGDAEFAKDVPLVRAGGGIDVGAPVAGELDGGHADAARARVDQDGLALAQPAQVGQAVVRGQVRDGERGGLLVGPGAGGPYEVAAVDRGARPERAGQQAHDAVAGV